MTFLPPKSLLQDRYLVIRKIGEGGMGAVYEAKDQRLGHRVALKQMTISDEEVGHAFEREARMLARLDHPVLPHVSDYFRSREGEFLVMKYIPGDDLESLLYKQGHPFPVEIVVRWMFELLDALEYLHAHSPPIIHRDIKPANLKLSPQRKIILLDFGISKGGLSDQTRFTTSKSIYAFTPHYAPLEQINAQGTDQRSDLYSVAATFYHLLTARELPTAATRAGAQITDSADPLLPAHKINPQVPVTLAMLLAQTMSLNPAQRPQSATAMRVALEQAMRGNLPNFGSQSGAAEQFPKTVVTGSQSGAPEQFPKTVVTGSQSGAPEQFPKTVVSRSSRSQTGANYRRGVKNGPVGQQQAPYPDVRPHTSPRGPQFASTKSKSWLPIGLLALLGIAILGFLLFVVIDPFADESELAAITPSPKPTVTRRATAEVIEEPAGGSTSTETPTAEPTLTELESSPTEQSSPTVAPTSTETPTVEPPSIPDLTDGTTRFSEKDGMKIIWVSAGDFLMGSLDDEPLAEDHEREKPQRTVYLDGFWIDQTEVTVGMFARFVEETNYETYAESEENSYVYQGDGKWEKIDGANWKYPQGPDCDCAEIESYPVVHVSWNDARRYCEWAGRRLPTEAEWEKAARGSDGRIYPWGNQEIAGNLVNFCDNNCPKEPAERNYDDGYPFTAPVGSYPDGASPVGALDMVGNVWEWVADWYNGNYYSNSPAENPLGPEIGEQRVLRGGSWSNNSSWTRTALRHKDPPADPNDERGFRCASDP